MIDYVDAGSGVAGWSGGSAGAGWAGAPGITWWCGNGVIDPGEVCELMDLNGATCSSLGFLGGGLLTCSKYCNYDVSQCRLQPTSGPDQPIDAGIIDDDAGVAQP